MMDEIDRLKNARLLAIMAKGEYVSGKFRNTSAVHQ